MSDIIEEVKEEVKKDEKFPILAIRKIWPIGEEIHCAIFMIKPQATEICKISAGEDTFEAVAYNLGCGLATLYIGWTVKTEEDKKLVEDETTSFEKVVAVTKDYAGYMITKFHPGLPRDIHIWQVGIVPKYQNTNLKRTGLKELERRFRENGIEEITLESTREGWHTEAAEHGFVETFTKYRKSLKERQISYAKQG